MNQTDIIILLHLIKPENVEDYISKLLVLITLFVEARTLKFDCIFCALTKIFFFNKVAETLVFKYRLIL